MSNLRISPLADLHRLLDKSFTDKLKRFLSCNTNLIEESEIKVILNCTSKNFSFASHFTSEAMELLISPLSLICSCKKNATKKCN